MESRLKYKKDQLKQAINDFKKSLNINIDKFDEELADVVKSGQVQKYEFCSELLWKTMKVFLLEEHGFEENSPRFVVKRFYLIKILTAVEYEAVLQILEDRNLLSHIYNKQQFLEIYKRVIKTASLFEKILSVM